MISHEHRCIFIHIPKCAGTSIEAALGHLDGRTGRGLQDHRGIRMLEQPLARPVAISTPSNAREVVRRLVRPLRRQRNDRNRLRLTRHQYESYFKFTIVRNPWARAVSAYDNVMRDATHRSRHGLVAAVPFAEYLRRFAGQRMLTPQMDFIRDFSGKVPLDFIGRFENLAADFAKACQLMGLREEVELPHALRAPSATNYRERYDDASRELIRRTYREEVALFGYDF